MDYCVVGGMFKLDAKTMKRYFAVFNASVFSVAEKWHFSGGKLHSYLMSATCVKENFNK